MDHDKKDEITAKNCEMNQFQNHPMFYPVNQEYINYFHSFPYPHVMPNGHPSKYFINPLQFSTEIVFGMFMESQAKLYPKEKMEMELFLAVLIDCLNQHYELLEDERVRGNVVNRYTS